MSPFVDIIFDKTIEDFDKEIDLDSLIEFDKNSVSQKSIAKGIEINNFFLSNIQ